MPQVLDHHASEPNEQWHLRTAEELLSRFRSSLTGLTTQEAEQRLKTDGPNELTEERRISPFRILLGQFNSLIVWILIAAGLISALLGESIDAAAIGIIILLNAVIGFYQEYSAERSIAALRNMTAPQAKVVREGNVVLIPAAGVVTGDILVLETGDLVAADARIIASASLFCIESALTGESVAVAKKPDGLQGADVALGDRSNMVFMGTGITAGTARGIVVAVSMRTELGRIAVLIQNAGEDERTPLEAKLDAFGRVLVWASLGIVAVLFLLGYLRGTGLLELFMTAVSLAVAAVPEGLPAMVTIALALGVLRMSRRRALVRKLPAVETLGSTTVICTDKTGTLTMGEMTVRALFVNGTEYEVTGQGYGPEGEVRIGGKKAEGEHAAPLLELASVQIGCNNSHRKEEAGVWSVIGDPTEGALLTAGLKAGGNREQFEQEQPKQHEFPFDSDRKRSSVIRKRPDGTLRVYTNGAPGIMIERCTKVYAADGVREITPEDREHILQQTTAMAKKALRVLCSAYRDLSGTTFDGLTPDEAEQELVFVGLTGMYDPPRAEAREAIEQCRAAGVRVVMITGDHPETAAAVAREIGIASADDAAVSGVELQALSDEELKQRVSSITVYARVTAEHKLRIVRAWKANDAVVAMTGDGVNDAPAMKGADIGIAMGRTGTEVTKQASDMIITDDNFSTIVSAIEEGRGIYDNIRKTLQYLLAGNAGELMLMTVCVVIGFPVPLLPIHLLWINLVTDGLPALCLATNPIDPEVMKQHPRSRSENITDRSFLTSMVFTGLLTASVSFAVYWYMLQSSSAETARSYAFTVLVFEELIRSFGARSATMPVWRIPFFSNRNLVIVVALSFGLQWWIMNNETVSMFLKTSAIPAGDFLLLLAVGAIPLAILEIGKGIRNSRQGNKVEEKNITGTK
jgi:Ca2+-transporting ATPase